MRTAVWLVGVMILFSAINISQAENQAFGTGYDFFFNHTWNENLNYNNTFKTMPKLPGNFGPDKGFFNTMVYSAVNPMRMPISQALPYAPYPQLSAPKYVATEYKPSEKIVFVTKSYQVKKVYANNYQAKPFVPVVVKKVEPMINNYIYGQKQIQDVLK